IGLGGERPDGTDLHRVARERRPEVLARGDRDAFARTTSEQLDEPVAADLVAEARAPRAQDAALAVQLDERRERDRLLVRALGLGIPTLAGAERHRLILQGAFASAVADRAVERVVQQQELQVRDLGSVGLVRRVLGAHHHARRDLGRARGEQLALPLDLHVALAARADRIQERVVAEPGDLDPEVLRGPDDQRPLRDDDLRPVHRERDGLGLRPRAAHVSASVSPASVAIASPEPVAVSPPGPTPVNGQRRSAMWASYSSRKYLRLDSIGLTAPSASAQNALYRMFPPSSSR